ncbi:hypothetical protein DVG78_02935 [Runella aurantiaca]|uniref:Uncharacterized protein n=2 Tax=Runella aurantiaca TaxID=2282308 RepID=A0A369II71_9BACT|nr:hypothetical protein DVG78_02935 [Runella aurantiaca]
MKTRKTRCFTGKKNAMKSTLKHNFTSSNEHWKRKWSWRQNHAVVRPKPKSDTYDTQEFRNTPFPDGVTF